MTLPLRLGRLVVIGVAVAAFTSGCTLAKPDPGIDQFSRRFIKAVELGDSATVAAESDSNLTTPDQWGRFAVVSDTLRKWQPDSVRLVGWSITRFADSSVAWVGYELHGPTGWGSAEVRATRKDGGLRATGLRINRLPSSLSQMNAFRLANLPWYQYAFLAVAVASALCCVIVAIVIWRTPMPRRRLWAVLSLVGVGQCGMNWTTGETFLQPFSLKLLGVSVVRSGWVGPWIVGFALPAGAAYALWRRYWSLPSQSSTESHETAG